MKVSDFDYRLPAKRIALYPPTKRGTTRLLVLNKITDEVEHKAYSDLVDYVEPGDVVVLNNTKVIKARLLTKKSSGKQQELLLVELHGSRSDSHKWQALYRGKLSVGEILEIGQHQLTVKSLLGEGLAEITSQENLLALAERFGKIPLPPYIKRPVSKSDNERYQTEFAQSIGSVAAPTASLNFTNSLKQRLESHGAKVVNITLHVGLGTFLPIRNDNVEEHTMHSEYFEVSKETAAVIQRAKHSHKRVIAVGTTVTRTLEYCADELLNGSSKELVGEANIFIYPGYKFKLVDAMVTNFHAPRSTVLMMAAAFAGWSNLKGAYDEALSQNYSFLSYGDSMFIY